MNKMKYKTLREKMYYQLGYCAGFGEMGREVRGYLKYQETSKGLQEYVEFEEKDNKEMLTKIQKKLRIETLNGSMADDELVCNIKE